jgi:hypothetical protein
MLVIFHVRSILNYSCKIRINKFLITPDTPMLKHAGLHMYLLIEKLMHLVVFLHLSNINIVYQQMPPLKFLHMFGTSHLIMSTAFTILYFASAELITESNTESAKKKLHYKRI